MRSSIQYPPLPLWTRPKPDQPAHGILIDLATRNGYLTLGEVSASTELKVARLRIGYDAERLAELIRCDPSEILTSTPTFSRGEFVTIRGERIRLLRDLDRKCRRLCVRCVSHAPYHRFWFDLRFVTTCPEHGIELIDHCSCGMRLGWHDGRVYKCHTCTDGDIRTIEPRPADPDVARMDRWLLARLGVGSFPDRIPLLDALSLDDAIDMMGRIGSLDLGGYQERWAEPQDFALPLERVRAHGFRVIVDGAIEVALDRAYAGFLASGSTKPASLGTAYGWFYHWFNFRKGEALSPALAEILLGNALMKFQVQRGTFPNTFRNLAPATLSAAATAVRARPGTVRKLLEAENGIRRQKRKGSPVSIPAADVRRLADDYAASIPLERVAQVLGVGGGISRKLVATRSIPIWIAGGKRGTKHRHVIRRRDLEAWVASLIGDVASVSDVPEGCITLAEAPKSRKIPITVLLNAIKEGLIKVQARLDGRPNFGGAIVRTADVDAAVPADVRRRMGARRSGPRGPYRKRLRQAATEG